MLPQLIERTRHNRVAHIVGRYTLRSSDGKTWWPTANGVGQKSRRSAAIEGGLAPGTAAEADAEAPSEAQPVDAADYWTPVQQEPSGECYQWEDS